MRRPRVGELPASQLLYSSGVGSVVELPNLSVMVMGLDDWDTRDSSPVSEERLLRSVRGALGPQVAQLLLPPVDEDEDGPPGVPFSQPANVGVPVAPFPRWMLCTICRALAREDSGRFERKVDRYHTDRTKYVHANCAKSPNRPPLVVPARFLVACERGHVDDFPWVEFVHDGKTDCRYDLVLYDSGPSGEAADITVECLACGVKRSMAHAFEPSGREALKRCHRCWPHLRVEDDEPCDAEQRPMLLGASNAWFPVTVSALTIPASSTTLDQLVEEHWLHLEKAEGPSHVAMVRGFLSGLPAFTEDEIWAVVCRRREGGEAPQGGSLRAPEWRAFTQPDSASQSRDFRLRVVAAPDRYEQLLERVVLAERLREVSALVGFTRITSPTDFGDVEDLPGDRVAPLSRAKPTWALAGEVRGEGVFLQFREEAVQDWTARCPALDHEFFEAHRRWRRTRKLPPEIGYPGLRYVLLHSFAHMLLRQFALECGYGAASVRERIYSLGEDAEGGPMAGVLLYTAAPDSDGTLGGLVSLGEPRALGHHLDQGLEQLALCASDPLCAERRATDANLSLHGAACHACLFAPETSCERGNKYLDRSVLVATVDRDQFAFFEE